MVQVHGVHGGKLRETYFMTIYLPNKVAVSNVRATQGALREREKIQELLRFRRMIQNHRVHFEREN
jgi:hypothetical protein